MSVRLLHKMFAAAGRSFGDTLRELRLEHGRKCLAGMARRVTILEIALESGYGNLSCFSRAFRQRYGLSPSEYRAAAKACIDKK
jgi:AraC-like DNA-binding protein